MSEMDTLLSELREAGQHPDRALLDRIAALGPAVIPALIEIATDESLHFAETDSPAVWAPLHAVQLLGELRAVEAIEPLLPLFAWEDDDWIAYALADAFGQIGAPAVPALTGLLQDRAHDIWMRARVASALTAIAERHPELRAEVVSILTARLDPAESRTPDDETFNGFIICELLDLTATESLPAILRAYSEDRVDRLVVDDQDVWRELGLSPGRPVAATGGLRPRARAAAKVGRNDPCPCGSGKKFKRCCGR
jgi:hypothetical protein